MQRTSSKPSLLMIVSVFLILVAVILQRGDTFEVDQLGGDKLPPTPFGSVIWWLLMNSTASFATSSWVNETSTSVTNSGPTATDYGRNETHTVLTSTVTVPTLTSVSTLSSTVSSNAVGLTSVSPMSTETLSTTSPRQLTLSGINTLVTEQKMTTPVPVTSTAKEPVKKKEPTIDRATICRQYGEEELYDRLQDVGAYNQHFMANTPEDIGYLSGFRFADEIDDHAGRFVRSVGNTSRAQRECVGKCQKISHLVRQALSQLSSSSSAQRPLARDTQDNALNRSNDAILASRPTSATSTPATRTANIDGSCRLEHFIPIGLCDQRAEEEYFGLDRLCTACRGVYKLPVGCFPQFLNAITCNNTDLQCIFDVWTKQAHGECREKTITFTVMRNLGTELCQEWRYESLDVPIGCQCYLNKASWLRA